ncbi:MAG: hypothetical protein V1853_05065 [bacterium]
MSYALKRKRLIFISGLSAVILAGFGILLAHQSQAGLEWEVQKAPKIYQDVKTNFNAVKFVQNPSDGKYLGWIVGDQLYKGPEEPVRDTVMFYNGSFWEVFDDDALSANPETLNDVDAIYYESGAQYLVWAVGNNGRIWYWRNSSIICDPVAPCPDKDIFMGANLTAVAAVDDASEIVVFVGENDGKIRHGKLSGINEKLMFSSSANVTGGVFGIEAVDPTHVWAVTDQGKIYRNSDINGNTWILDYEIGNVSFTGIEAIKVSETRYLAWASAYTPGGKGQIYDYDSDRGFWELQHTTVANIQINDVSAFYNPALDLYNAYAVGNIDNDSQNGAIFQFNGHIWERQDSNNDGEHLNGVSAASLTEVRAVGQKSNIITSTPGNIFGWLWLGASTNNNSRDSIGWGSGSCANQDYCESAGFTYGVNIRRSGANQGAIAGYIWLGDADPNAYIKDDCNIPAGEEEGVCDSNDLVECDEDTDCRCSENINICQSTGWLSFNKYAPVGLFEEESGVPPAQPFNDGNQNYIAKFDPSTGKVVGWGRLLSLKQDANDGGWIKLRGEDVTANPAVIAPFGECKNCATFCSGDTSIQCSGNECEDAEAGTCTVEVCKICNTTADVYDSADETKISCNMCSTDGGSCTRRCKGNHTVECASDGDMACSAYGGVCLGTIFCDTCASCDSYGVSIDDATGKVTGFGWSGNSAEQEGELGWVDFSRTNYYSQAWLQTKFGDIYARADIGSANTPSAPSDKCNATYVISAAGTISNYCTLYGQGFGEVETGYMDRPYFQQGYESIYFPSESNNYTNVLGSIDLNGTITDIGDGKNKYGNKIVNSDDKNLTELGLCAIGVNLDNTVYNINNDFTIGRCDSGEGYITEWKINNRDITNPNSVSGAGTIVVQGDLTIDVNIVYQAENFDKIRDLASLGIIVKGSIIITGNVRTIVGSYIAFGDPGYTNKTNGIEIENSLDEKAFQAQGLMISPSYKFGRTFRGTLTDPLPAEEITYDGRVIANPPPGFSDFAQVLPRIREEIPF